MDSNELKQALKDARGAIKQKEFKAALKHCKTALKLDKECYMAWVFVGVAAQEIDQLDQAVAAFQRACSISPDQILAWQGLCALYEKNESRGDFENDRHPVYMKLIELSTNDIAKQIEIAEKVTSHYRNNGDAAKYVNALEECAKIIGNIPEMTKLWRSLVDFSTAKVTTYPENHQELLLKAYAYVTFSNETDRRHREELFRSYIDALLKTGHKKEIISEAKKFGECYPELSAPMEILSGMYIDSVLSSWEEPELSEDFDKISEFIEKCDNPLIRWLAKATYLYASGNAEGALKTLLNDEPRCDRRSREARLLFSLCYLKMRYFFKAEVEAKCGVSSSLGESGDWLSQKLLLCLAEAFCAQRYHEEALAALQKMEPEHASRRAVLWCSFEIALLSRNFDKAEEDLSSLQSIVGESSKLTEARAHLLVERGIIAEAQEILTSLEQKSPGAIHLLARIHWERGQYDEAVPMFIEAAQLDPGDYRNFIYLGKHSFYHKKDMQLTESVGSVLDLHYVSGAWYKAAIKCFQKAVQLNKANEEAVTLLSEALCQLGYHNQNIQFLKAVTSEIPAMRAKWAWKRLSDQYMKLGEMTEAVRCLQKLIGAYPKDQDCLECLGEAYLMQKRLWCAFQCFKACLEMDPRNIFLLYQMGTIRLLERRYREATEYFETALGVDPGHVPTLKGLAEARLALTREHLERGLCALGLDNWQVAVNSAARALALDTKVVGLWKLMGDICLIPELYGLGWASLRLPADMQLGDLGDSSREQLLKASKKCYIKAVRMKPRLSQLWHDLGLALWLEARLRKSKSKGRKALASIRKAIALAPKRFAYWNSLGVVALTSGKEDHALAERCFRKSLELESNNLYALTNLGAIYLLADNLQLAHEAFDKARALDTSALRPWMGMAFIAENLLHRDMVDLFRQCTALGHYGDAARAYGYWLLKQSGLPDIRDHDKDELAILCNVLSPSRMLRNEDNVRIKLAFVSDAVSHTVDMDGGLEPATLNLLGLFLERQGLLRSARDTFRKALALPDQANDNINCMRVNLARVLGHLGSYEEAIQLYLQTESRSQDVLCLLGFCYGKLGELAEALKVYEEARSKSQPEEKGEVDLAMAVVTLKASGASAAKDFLQDRLSGTTQSRESLEALCCLSMLAADTSASHGYIQSILKLATSGALHHRRTASLLFCQNFAEDRDYPQQISRTLSDAVRQLPDRGILWSTLAQALLAARKPGAVHCALVALARGDWSSRHLATLVLARLVEGKAKKAFRAAQKMVLLYPDLHQAWVLLGMAICDCRVVADKALQYDRFLLGANTLWKLWSSLVQVQYACIHQQWQKVSELVPLVLWGFEGSPHVSKVLTMLQAFADSLRKSTSLERVSLSPLQSVVESENVAIGWQMLSKLQQMTRNYSEAIESLEKAKKCDRMEDKAMELELRQAWLALCSAKADSTRREELLNSALEHLNKVLRTNPKCVAGHLILAVWSLESDNSRLAEKSLDRVVRLHGHGTSWIRSVALRLLFLHHLKKNDSDALKQLVEMEQVDVQSLNLSEENTAQLTSIGLDLQSLILSGKSAAELIAMGAYERLLMLYDKKAYSL